MMIEEKDFSKVDVSEETKKKIIANAEKLFKSLFDDFKLESKPDPVVALNSALCFMCMIQNSFYSYELRDDFADSIAHAMKNNKGPAPVIEQPLKPNESLEPKV